jgi:hypothetical protein
VHYELTAEGQTIKILIWWFWNICKMWEEECDLKCELQEAESSIMIICLLTQHWQLDNPWQNIQFLSFHNTPIKLTSPLPTFFYSLNSKLPSKEDFRPWKTSLMCQMTWRRYHKHPSNGASKSEKGSGRGAFLWKDNNQ